MRHEHWATMDPTRASAGEQPLWVLRRDRRRSRRELLAAIANLVALHVLAFTAVLTLRYGFLSGIPLANHLANAVLLMAGGFDLYLLVWPRRAARAAERAVSLTGEVLLRPVTTVLVTLVWIVTWPLARTVGRRGLVKRHPGTRAWFSNEDWRVGTWSAKCSEADSANRRQGSTLLRTLGWFLERGSFFTLLLVILLLLALSLSVFAQTPTLAPFIYTLF